MELFAPCGNKGTHVSFIHILTSFSRPYGRRKIVVFQALSMLCRTLVFRMDPRLADWPEEIKNLDGMSL